MIRMPIQVAEERLNNGMIVPKAVLWFDGRIFRITKILFYNPASDEEFEGIRYTVIIGSVEKYIYRANHNWYVMVRDGGDKGEEAHYL